MTLPSIETETHSYDVLIIGAGGAGLTAAMHASRAGLNTAVISKVDPLRSHTVAAKGGINAALGTISPDHWHWHMYDTIRGGDWLCDMDAVEWMCSQAAKAITELEHLGVPFSRQDNGRLYQRKYGGQSSDFGQGKPPERACAVADRTGHTILQTLYQQALRHRTCFFVEHVAVSLLIEDNQCCGAVCWDMDQGMMRVIYAPHVILASGGFGYAWSQTTSSSICTGDGNALVLAAGLPLQDMEFIQFHPTGLYPSGILISEAARGEGGRLLNSAHEPFMQRYAPNYGDLAARDVITRAIATEIAEGRGAGENQDHIWLDIRHLNENTVSQKLPSVRETARVFAKVDVSRELIPVAPSVHYCMGGIPTNRHGQVLNQNHETVTGLYAIGETACASVHGTNRLGCNGLLELVVFGKACIEHITENPAQLRRKSYDSVMKKFAQRRTSEPEMSLSEMQKLMQETLQLHVGVSRDATGLKTAINTLQSLYHQLSSASYDYHIRWNQPLLHHLELSHMCIQALATAQSALKRQESRGAHYRTDYPDKSLKYSQHTLIWREEEAWRLSTSPIRKKTIWSNTPVFEEEESRSY